MVEVPSDEPKAVVIDRQVFDQTLSQRAVAEGVDVLTGRRFCEFDRSNGKVKVRLEGPEGETFMSSPLLVGADGYKSRVAKNAGLGPCRESVRGIQVDLDFKLDDQAKVEVYVGKSVAPGFFGWVLPCGERTRVGLCVSPGNGPPSKYLSALLERRGLEKAPRDRLFSGAIPIGPPDRTVADNVMLVGDAAGMTKPLSGGGIFTGLRAARLAARTAMQAMEENDTSMKFLSAYEREWRAEIGKELERGALIRKVYLGMTDKKLDELGRMIDRDDVKEVMTTGEYRSPLQASISHAEDAPLAHKVLSWDHRHPHPARAKAIIPWALEAGVQLAKIPRAQAEAFRKKLARHGDGPQGPPDLRPRRPCPHPPA